MDNGRESATKQIRLQSLLMILISFNFFANSDLVEIPAQDTIKLSVLTKGVLESFSLEFEVQNAIFAPRKHPVITIKVQ